MLTDARRFCDLGLMLAGASMGCFTLVLDDFCGRRDVWAHARADQRDRRGTSLASLQHDRRRGSAPGGRGRRPRRPADADSRRWARGGTRRNELLVDRHPRAWSPCPGRGLAMTRRQPNEGLADQETLAFSSRTCLSVSFTARIDNAGESRSRYQNAFHHAGSTMITSPRNTARIARSAKRSGAIGREG